MSGRAVILTPLPRHSREACPVTEAAPEKDKEALRYGDGNPKPVFEKMERPWIPAYAGMTEAAPEKDKEAGP